MRRRGYRGVASTLPERRRKRLIHPLSNVRAWRAATATPEDNRRQHDGGDCQRDALIHWRRFRRCLEAMPPDEARTLWCTLSGEVDITPAHTRTPVGTAVGMDTMAE